MTASASGDEIWIKEGDYQENVVLPHYAIAIRGGFAGVEKSPGERELGVNTTSVGDASHEGTTISHFTSLITGRWSVLIEDLQIRGGLEGCIDFFEGNGYALKVTLRRLKCEHEATGKAGDSFRAGQILNMLIDSCEFKQRGVSEIDPDTEGGVMYLSAFQGEIRNSVVSLDIRPEEIPDRLVTVLRIPQLLYVPFHRGIDIINSVVYRSETADEVVAISGRVSHPGSPTVVGATNSIVVGDRSRIEENFVYCNVFDASAAEGVGNISVDPLFVNPEEGDFRLQANSPCIDSGTVVALAEDIDGNPRPVDIPGVGHSGAAAFDMGAYELQKVDALHGDLNGDGEVDAEDLCLILREWRKGNGQ
jgi:hypothetical protein